MRPISRARAGGSRVQLDGFALARLLVGRDIGPLVERLQAVQMALYLLVGHDGPCESPPRGHQGEHLAVARRLQIESALRSFAKRLSGARPQKERTPAPPANSVVGRRQTIGYFAQSSPFLCQRRV